MKAPQPQNVSELKSFLGMVNFYGKFIPRLYLELQEKKNSRRRPQLTGLSP